MELNRMTFTQPDGFRTVYYRGGSGRTLVFLHGGGIDAGCYRELLERLAERYDVIAPNLAGHGGTSRAGRTWGWDEYAGQIRSLLRHLNVAGAVTVGHSFGGGVAAHLATSDLSTRSLVLIDSAGTPLRWSLGSMLHLMCILRITKSFRYRGFGVTARLMCSTVANFLRAGIHAPAALASLRPLLTSSDDTFARIQVPTLILWGSDDKVFPLPAAEKIKSQMTNAELQVIDGDHEWCLYQPQLAAEKILGF